MKHNIFYYYVFTFLLPVLFVSCSDSKTQQKKHTVTSHNINRKINEKAILANTDTVQLTTLVKNMYRWHETYKMKHNGFSPVKINNTDTVYRGIDLTENKQAINELRNTGFFTDGFLNNYSAIALRMNKELRDGSSQWKEGELATFDTDTNEWYNCQDSPVDDYWKIIKLTDIKIDHDSASLKWTWGDNFFYRTKAVKVSNSWKIDYLQGFDMKNYNWGRQK